MDIFIRITLFNKKLIEILKSKILLDNKIKAEFIKMLLNFVKIELIYRGTDDGFEFSDFERKIFNK